MRDVSGKSRFLSAATVFGAAASSIRALNENSPALISSIVALSV
jgi:hypothetical protein